MLLFVSAKCFAHILSICARCFMSIPTISAVFNFANCSAHARYCSDPLLWYFHWKILNLEFHSRC